MKGSTCHISASGGSNLEFFQNCYCALMHVRGVIREYIELLFALAYTTQPLLEAA
jgi:hypothetical protein